MNSIMASEYDRREDHDASPDVMRFRLCLMKAPKTIRSLMLCVGAVGLALGIGINVAPYQPLITVALIVMSPQIVVIAICAYLSIREERMRSQREHTDK
jgi:hypothetical protein